jgi:hypothetical protein
MPPPTQPCSWSNLSPAMYCPCHHQHNQAAGVTSHELCTAHTTTNTPLVRHILPMPQPPQPCSWSNLSTSHVLPMSPPTQPCSWSNLSTSSGLPTPPPTQSCSWSNLTPAMYCTCHHQFTHAADATSRQPCTTHAATNTSMQLE